MMKLKVLGPVLLLAMAAVALFFLAREPDAGTPTAGSPHTAVGTATPIPPPPSTPPPPARSSAPASDPADTKSDRVVEPEGDIVDPGVGAIPRNKSQANDWAAARATAAAFLKAFARPPTSVPDQVWWRGVKKYLAQRVAADYERVDPAEVPFRRLTGKAHVVPVDAPAHLVIVVQIPTDTGDYQVELETTATGRWVTSVAPVSR